MKNEANTAHEKGSRPVFKALFSSPIVLVTTIALVIVIIPILAAMVSSNKTASEPRAATNNSNYKVVKGRIVTNAPTSTAPAADTGTSSSNLAIAKKVLDWIDTQKNEEGKYFLDQSSNNSLKQLVDGRMGVIVAWARYLYWRETKDVNMLNQMKLDLNVYIVKQANKIMKPYQPDFWSCKLLYDIGTDPSLPQEIKDQAKKICWRSAVTNKSLGGGPDGTLDEEIKLNPISLKQNLDTFFTDKSNRAFSTDNQPVNMDTTQLFRNITSSSDFAKKYTWSKNKINLDIAESLFSLSLDIYSKQPAQDYVNSECLLGVSALDLYEASSNTKYLKFANDLYISANISDKSIKSSTFNQIICAIYAKQLNHVSKDNKYDLLINSIKSNILEKNYDSISLFSQYANEKVRETKINSLFINVLLPN